ncbi:DUF1622 domain-containing protein [Ectothiorhodospiraceae bacterium 2226]|nr:DUF1622 domain-containing protein [Ectothiorhodospiraceae bacterium 2226]
MHNLFYTATGGLVLVLEALSVAIITLGVAIAIVLYLVQGRRVASHAAYIDFRHRVGRSIILGLDLLIAADIIKTVLVQESVTSLVALGVIVLIRAFLSLTLFVEVEGTLPWRAAARREERD